MTEAPPSIFWEIHSGLPREGPGDDESTRTAYRLCSSLPDRPRILDIGCGPGAQTIALARLSKGRITAVDTHQPFLDELARRARDAGVADHVTALNASMFSLPFDPESFDLIWSEGAMYMLGFREALREWKPLLASGGYLAVTEPCWLKSEVPNEVREFWDQYPAMTTIAERLRDIAELGYHEIGHFVLPESSWWDGYYTPMASRLEMLRGKYAGGAAALAEISTHNLEIDMYRRYADTYGYVFFVTRKAS